jgi:hypothetical protein
MKNKILLTGLLVATAAILAAQTEKSVDGKAFPLKHVVTFHP